MRLIEGFNDILFHDDDICYFCGIRVEDKSFLCPDCKFKLEYMNRRLNIDSPYFEEVIFSLFYNEFIRQKLYQYKYNGKGYYYKPLGEILINTINATIPLENIDIITYVPIHRRKKAQRGYDQSELLAKYIGETLNIPFSTGNLIRTKWTRIQNKMDKYQRIKSLRGAFEIKEPLEFKDKEILLIDDIITTGGTLNECGKKLKEVKAGKIHALTITSGLKI